VTGSNPDRKGSVEVFVIGAEKTLSLNFAKPEVKVGRKQTVTVTGLAEGEKVTLVYDGKQLVSGVADANGEFTHTFPVGTSTGVREVAATGQLPGRTGSNTFVVLS
jgi:hypothetical protein